MPNLCLKDGANLYFQDIGAGVPIMLVHGFGMTSKSFWPQIELAQNARLIIPDLRGCGKSTLGTKPLNLSTMAEDLHELVTHLGLEKVIYIGWSMGALILWNATDKSFMKSIDAMIAIDMSVKLANENDWEFGLKGLKDTKSVTGESRIVRALNEMRTNWPKAAERMIAKVLAAPRKIGAHTNEIEEKLYAAALENNGTNQAVLWRALLDCDARENVDCFNVKTVIIQGLKSQLYAPEVCENVAQCLPNAQLISFENSGHAPHLEEAQKFNELVKSVLRDESLNSAAPSITNPAVMAGSN